MATSGAKKVSWAEIRFWRILLLVSFLALWEVSTRQGWIDKFFVSQPTVLGAQLGEWIWSGFIFRHLLVTMKETIIGFVLGTILGVAVGFLFAHWEKLAHIFDPLMVALNAMPRVVLAPLFILWFGLGLLSKVVMVISLVFFVVFFSTFTGLREVDRDLINNARILGATPRHMSQFRQLRIVHPISVDRTVVYAYSFRLKGAPVRMFHDTVAFSNVVNGTASPVLTDDLEVYERTQEGLTAQRSDWVFLGRGQGRDVADGAGVLRGGTGTSEIHIRNQLAAWLEYMTAES